jgi:hypothetical protein
MCLANEDDSSPGSCQYIEQADLVVFADAYQADADREAIGHMGIRLSMEDITSLVGSPEQELSPPPTFPHPQLYPTSGLSVIPEEDASVPSTTTPGESGMLDSPLATHAAPPFVKPAPTATAAADVDTTLPGIYDDSGSAGGMHACRDPPNAPKPSPHQPASAQETDTALTDLAMHAALVDGESAQSVPAPRTVRMHADVALTRPHRPPPDAIPPELAGATDVSLASVYSSHGSQEASAQHCGTHDSHQHNVRHHAHEADGQVHAERDLFGGAEVQNNAAAHAARFRLGGGHTAEMQNNAAAHEAHPQPRGSQTELSVAHAVEGDQGVPAAHLAARQSESQDSSQTAPTGDWAWKRSAADAATGAATGSAGEDGVCGSTGRGAAVDGRGAVFGVEDVLQNDICSSAAVDAASVSGRVDDTASLHDGLAADRKVCAGGKLHLGHVQTHLGDPLCTAGAAEGNCLQVDARQSNVVAIPEHLSSASAAGRPTAVEIDRPVARNSSQHSHGLQADLSKQLQGRQASHSEKSQAPASSHCPLNSVSPELLESSGQSNHPNAVVNGDLLGLGEDMRCQDSVMASDKSVDASKLHAHHMHAAGLTDGGIENSRVAVSGGCLAGPTACTSAHSAPAFADSAAAADGVGGFPSGLEPGCFMHAAEARDRRIERAGTAGRDGRLTGPVARTSAHPAPAFVDCAAAAETILPLDGSVAHGAGGAQTILPLDGSVAHGAGGAPIALALDPSLADGVGDLRTALAPDHSSTDIDTGQHRMTGSSALAEANRHSLAAAQPDPLSVKSSNRSARAAQPFQDHVRSGGEGAEMRGEAMRGAEVVQGVPQPAMHASGRGALPTRIPAPKLGPAASNSSGSAAAEVGVVRVPPVSTAHVAGSSADYLRGLQPGAGTAAEGCEVNRGNAAAAGGVSGSNRTQGANISTSSNPVPSNDWHQDEASGAAVQRDSMQRLWRGQPCRQVQQPEGEQEGRIVGGFEAGGVGATLPPAALQMTAEARTKIDEASRYAEEAHGAPSLPVLNVLRCTFTACKGVKEPHISGLTPKHRK